MRIKKQFLAVLLFQIFSLAPACEQAAIVASNLIVENHDAYRASVFWMQTDGTEGNIVVDPKNNVNIGAIDNVSKIRIQPVGDYQQYYVSASKLTGGWLIGPHNVDVDYIKKEPIGEDQNYRIYIYPKSKFFGGWHVTVHNSQAHPCYLPIYPMFKGDWISGIFKNPFKTNNPMDAFPGCQHILDAHQEVLPSHIINIDRYNASNEMIRYALKRLFMQWSPLKFPYHQLHLEHIRNKLRYAYRNIGREIELVQAGYSVRDIQAVMKGSLEQFELTSSMAVSCEDI